MTVIVPNAFGTFEQSLTPALFNQVTDAGLG